MAASSSVEEAWANIVQIVKDRDFLKYVGVFTVKGEKIADAGPLEVLPNELRAIASLIKSPSKALVQINMSKLRFLCLGHGTGKLIGISNFNMETSPDAIELMDELLFKMTHKHFTRQSSIAGVHALQLGAVQLADKVLLGVSVKGRYSCLEELQSMKTLFKSAQITRANPKYSSMTRNATSVSTDV